MNNLSSMKRLVKSTGAALLNRTGALKFLWERDPSWRILMYHRVVDPETLTYPIQAGMYVRPKTFKMHCEILKAEANVVQVDDLVRAVLSNQSLSPRTVAVTFDDGWSDNIRNAYKILNSHNLPATVFLPTDFIGTTKLFWTDDIARALRAWPKDAAREYLTPQLIHEISLQPTEEERLEVLVNYLFLLSKTKRNEIIAQLTKRLSPNTQSEFISWQQAADLKSLGIQIGSHSHSHQLFNGLTESERSIELFESKKYLEEKGLLSSKLFVFPGGSHQREMAAEVLKAGYSASLGTMRTNLLNPEFPVFPRVGMHEDISMTEDLFKLRLAVV